MTPPSSDEIVHVDSPHERIPSNANQDVNVSSLVTTPNNGAQDEVSPADETTPSSAAQAYSVPPAEWLYDVVRPEEIATAESELTPVPSAEMLLRTPETPWELPIPSHLLAQTDVTEVQ